MELSPKKIIFISLALILIIDISIVCFVFSKKKGITEIPDSNIQIEIGDMGFEKEPSIPKEDTSFSAGSEAGEVGEIKDQGSEDNSIEADSGDTGSQVRPPDTVLPPVVFNTKGVIVSMGKDSIVVQGNGSNFEDQKPRVLTVKITSGTLTFEKGNTASYQGKEGLLHLLSGDQILIESSQNIRGKTEFPAAYINKI